MSRPYGTAIFAVVLASLVTGIADAKNAPAAPTPSAATALQSGSGRIADDAERGAPPSMPIAGADLEMWSAPRDAGRTEAEAATPAVRPPKADPIHRFARGIVSRTSSIARSLTRSAMRFIGTPYVFGGTSPSGFDCSGYTQHVFAMLGIALPRTADAQYSAGHATVGGMTSGDLVFFQTYEPGPSHVGIYVGNGKFVHSSSHGVMVSRLGDDYWRSRYIGAKRIASFQ
ncbi:MAG: hypothetical protein NVS3B16_01420 [Vulcanimicrobiaceae bacterium]